MAISDKLGKAPKIFFAVFISLGLGGLFLLVGLATPHWVDMGLTYYGIWQICRPVCLSYPALLFADIVYRGLCIISLLLAGASGLAALAFIPMESRRRTLAFLIAIGSILSFLANVIVNLWFGITFTIYLAPLSLTVHLGWSFALSCLGTSFVFLAGVLGFVMARSIPRPVLPVSGVIQYNPQSAPGYPVPGAQYNTQQAPGYPPGAQYNTQPAPGYPVPGAQYNTQPAPGQPGMYPHNTQSNLQQPTDKY